MLSDWSDTDPDTIYANLKKQSDYYNYHQRTAGTFMHDVREKGLRSTMSERLGWGRNDMTPTDIADVNSSTYIYLMNGNSPGANWTALFNPGERVRLRFINGSAMTLFDVRIPGLPMTVVQADGNCVQPVTVDEFRIGTAETYDVIVQPHEEKAYTIFAQPEARGRYARGTLAPRIAASRMSSLVSAMPGSSRLSSASCRYTTMTTPVSTAMPNKAIYPTHTATLKL
jgi:FtsP/CotA-like multicopper oxidase with cupredoxin domain